LADEGEDIMTFMGISVGILALVATGMLLFGRRGTLKILAWLVVLAVLGLGALVVIATQELWSPALVRAYNSMPAPPVTPVKRELTTEELDRQIGCGWENEPTGRKFKCR
jgi:hypothetical protein